MTEPVHPRFATTKARTHLGACDCGAVLFEVELDEQCFEVHSHSVWERLVPARSFRLLRGEESLSGHQFADQNAHHFYCNHCGVRAFTHWAPGAPAACTSFDLKGLHGRATSSRTSGIRRAVPTTI